MDKNTKILIPEIPGEWTERSRNGHKNIWNNGWHGQPHKNGLPTVTLEPPEKGLYAERIDGAWYWVSGCSRCNERGEKFGYIPCDKHNACIRCNTHRSMLTDIPWGHADGFICKPCADAEHAAAKEAALAQAAEAGHDEYDCMNTDEIICPHCASKLSSDDRHKNEAEATCEVCDGLYSLELDYSVTYTTSKVAA